MGARILVADDSVTIQKVVELTFSKEDFELIPARSGEEAIHRAKETRPDLMLIDLVMPDKGGYEVCRALRADPLLKDVPIILLTGTFEPFDKAEGAKVGANDFVTKPFESQALLSKVKQLLFARGAKGAPPAPAVKPPATPAGEELSADKLWELLETEPVLAPPRLQPPTAKPAPAAAGGTPEISLDDLPGVGPPVPGGLSLEDLTAPAPPGEISLDDLMGQPPAPAGELSLDDLVQAPAPPTAPGEITLEDLRTEPAPVAPGREISLEDLTAPAPPGEISLDDLMGQVAAPAEITLEDLTAGATAGPVEAAPIEIETFGERTLPAAEMVEEGPPVFELEPAPFDLPLKPVEAEGGETTMLFPPAAAPAPAAVRAAEPPLPPLEAAVPPTAVELEPAGAAPGAGGEVAGLSRAAADEIADRVVKELSEKLLHRIEQIVWEVVPELAEILITREIERVKATVQGKKAS